MPMLYIHQTSCISPQATLGEGDISILHQAVNQQLRVIEPAYKGIPPGVLRKMSKSVRMGMGAALPLMDQLNNINGIIIGTANAGMEDCFLFLKQLVEYEEGQLTPGNFVQSTPNALAAQLAMLTGNNGYNITHVHLGLAFENALIDAAMRLKEYPGHRYLLGALDDISSYNYVLNVLAGWYKQENFLMEQLYTLQTPGSIAGEGAAMFLVNGEKENALAQVKAIHTVHSTREGEVQQQLQHFLEQHLQPGENIDVLISGENGDCRLQKYYDGCTALLPAATSVVRFKHMCGEYPTASAMALWLACYILQQKLLPHHVISNHFPSEKCRHILLYNNHKGMQHGFLLVGAVD